MCRSKLCTDLILGYRKWSSYIISFDFQLFGHFPEILSIVDPWWDGFKIFIALHNLLSIQFFQLPAVFSKVQAVCQYLCTLGCKTLLCCNWKKDFKQRTKHIRILVYQKFLCQPCFLFAYVTLGPLRMICFIRQM